jgi:hypothetical protein
MAMRIFAILAQFVLEMLLAAQGGPLKRKGLWWSE